MPRCRSDRLATLAACHGALRSFGLHSLAASRAATPEQLARLHKYRAEIHRLVAASHLDVLVTLSPLDGATWSVACITVKPHDRLLSAIPGRLGDQHDELLSLTYDVRDADGERRAWRALVDVLKGA